MAAVGIPRGVSVTNASPLWAFVHVPKTAGSSINRMLSEWSWGQDHIEAFTSNPSEMVTLCARSSWVSGHVEYPALLASLRRSTTRPLRFVTAVREPTRQIASHYNWLMEIHHRGGAFYANHPERIRQISEHIRSTDNSDPAAVAARLREYAGLFLNQQSRVVLGTVVRDWPAGEIARALQCYDYVATESTVPVLIKKVTNHSSSSPILRENESGYHFDRSIFQHPYLQDFLSEHHASDHALYEAVKAM